MAEAILINMWKQILEDEGYEIVVTLGTLEFILLKLHVVSPKSHDRFLIENVASPDAIV